MKEGKSIGGTVRDANWRHHGPLSYADITLQLFLGHFPQKTRESPQS